MRRKVKTPPSPPADPNDDLPDFLRPPVAPQDPSDARGSETSQPLVVAEPSPPDGPTVVEADDLRLGDLQASSPQRHAPLDEIPSLTHILPTADPDIDELPPYAPGQPAITRALVDASNAGESRQDDHRDPLTRVSMGDTGFGVPVHDFTAGAALERDRPSPSADPLSTGSPPALPGLSGAAGSDTVPSSESSGVVEETGAVPEETWQRLGDVVADRLQDVTDSKGRDLIVKYVARIEILQAWQFNADLHNAPEWVDRNWLAYEDGPALNVTRPNGDHVGVAKRGDWVVRQNTTVDDAASPTGVRVLPDHIAVVTGAEFRRLYRASPDRDDAADRSRDPLRRPVGSATVPPVRYGQAPR